jgi:hypothetical protein
VKAKVLMQSGIVRGQLTRAFQTAEVFGCSSIQSLNNQHSDQNGIAQDPQVLQHLFESAS